MVSFALTLGIVISGRPIRTTKLLAILLLKRSITSTPIYTYFGAFAKV
ncbi:hypothetical protein FM106_19845 [Brachybacterium faecium]|nr:hypothetical protein FM106_19845 [Brachybacterium faecium]